MTPEQKQRLKEVEENRRIWYGGQGQVTADIDFLLSLVKSQEAIGDYSKLAYEIISEYNSADNPGLLRQKVAEGFAQVTASMRSACVEKVKALAVTHRAMAKRLTDAMLAELQKIRAEECDSIAEALESVSIRGTSETDFSGNA